MAAQHDDAPSFLPHVTLIGGLNKTGQEVLETAEKLAGEIEKFDISLLNVSRGSSSFNAYIPQEKRDEVAKQPQVVFWRRHIPLADSLGTTDDIFAPLCN
eukprot:gene5366-5583_t